MCGIVGYIGKNEAVPILIEGLKRMEYRGYDSAGLSVIDEKGDIKTIKKVGKVENLEKALSGKVINSSCGIAHTRWATHGSVTEVNSHPHWDCHGNIFIAHNGIIENYQEIKEVLIAEGHKFKSQTDTEVIAHLIEKFLYSSVNNDQVLENAVAMALKEIKGAYGIAVISKSDPDKIVVARNYSPLLIGIGDGEFIVASDASAILNSTNKVTYLNDGEIAVLTSNGVRFLDSSQKEIFKKSEILEGNLEGIQKGKFPHFMLKEIFEQPQSIRNSIAGRLIEKDGLAKLGGLESVQDRLRDINRIIIVGCGTAYLAGLIGEYMIEEYAGLPVEVEYASEFRYRRPIMDKNTVLLCISQSGETADTLAALREAKRKGILTLGIVNVVGSSIARETDAGIYNHIGPEIGVASTKALTSQICILTLLTLFLGRQRQMSLAIGQRMAKGLKNLPDLVEKILAQDLAIKNIAKKYYKHKDFLFLGRKYNFPVALEGALKLKEVSYIHAEGYGAGEMKHGPIALIDKNFPSFGIAPSDSVYDKMMSNLEEIKARKGPIIAVATYGNKEIKKLTKDVIYIPEALEILTPILSIIPLQLFAYYCAKLRGLDVDKPRNLAKSVTVE